MVAGRVHLRLGQGRDAILGPRPSLLETSILPRPVAHPSYIFQPSMDAATLGVPSLAVARPWPATPGPPAGQTAGHTTCHAAVLCCAVQAAAETRAHSSLCLHSAMTLGVQGPAAAFRFCKLRYTALFARPSLANIMPRLDRTLVTHRQAQAVFTGTVLSVAPGSCSCPCM